MTDSETPEIVESQQQTETPEHHIPTQAETGIAEQAVKADGAAVYRSQFDEDEEMDPSKVARSSLDSIPKYALVVLAAKRAKQVREGARTYSHAATSHPLTVAIKEIEEGKVKYRLAAEDRKQDAADDE